ncbi:MULTISPECIES: hypothetical protein [unclassified Nocardia]|uniref:hypothetical protein n=1 Tax=unclassified Nocardia TaxID=2637762 RepID=UPI001CE4AF93|nr:MULTISPECIES: hypothetical protein [unclassified Nocardia]
MATRSVPQPPFSPELLADLHADNVAPELRAELLPAVQRDPEAMRFLNSLDAVDAELRALGRDERIIHPMPDDVLARLTRFVDDLDISEGPTERVATVHRLPVAAPPESTAGPTDSEPMGFAEPIDLTARRNRRFRWLAAAAAAVAVVGAATFAITMTTDRSVPPTAMPSATATGSNNADLTPAAALSALGRFDVTGPLSGPNALNRCAAAAGYEHRTPLGAVNWTYEGKDAVLVLLTGPVAPKITALIVGTGCTAGDPQYLYATDIG